MQAERRLPAARPPSSLGLRFFTPCNFFRKKITTTAALK